MSVIIRIYDDIPPQGKDIVEGLQEKDMRKKIFNRVTTFYSLCAVLTGAALMAAFSILLSLYGEAQEPTVQVTTQAAIAFPENEKMLKETADKIAREGAALSTIEPAAGETQPASK